MEYDGLERVKNQGRHDIKNRWGEIERYWLDVVHTKTDEKYQTHQWLDPNKCLSYQKPQQEFEIFDQDFKKVVLDMRGMVMGNINIPQAEECDVS